MTSELYLGCGQGGGDWASVVGKKQLYKLKLSGFSFQMLVYSRLF